ncbi:hypothetical protein A3A79_00290 [Candidatus Gottesmanbacteria bacterium RIFCSPLOWO2_01_FULL_43_11b]|uniref:Mannosyl-glycoprotein endo-beta-N-acetylglucosamidase-like domain-containing protein n=1 Tax=Candidatus Gottesmanbacteria bacterium RIFCSPLOWO2_01_FULL_43_11b TaxID=1798392 RepID=A0A1F6AFY5_9BACT|nr:MAG: hypothetical protein A3A79_00290 [Candidatus Gottesmanbacteria bacterium RIFCSPLOWO2_01_FULL_43_11b]
MLMKYIALIALFLSALTPVFAEGESDAAASLVAHAASQDERVERLTDFLASQNSPFADEASYFVAEADRLNLDWKLVAAIAGVESTFGKHIPTGSYNAWGWGVFTGTQWGVAFANWRDGITQVSEGIKFNYIDKGAETIEQIGRIYAASPAWSWKVHFFLDQIEAFAPNDSTQLDITI